MLITRRGLIRAAGGAAALAPLGCADSDPGDGWDAGDLSHILPLVSHSAFNIKLSFREPIFEPPVLRVGTRLVAGDRQDSAGRFWAFRVGGLPPDTEFQLELMRGGGRAGRTDGKADALCESWPLRTFPAPDQRPRKLRIASFTCAGGPNLPIPAMLFQPFKSARYRRRLFDLVLEHEPDLVIANGDHVYFDLPALDRIRENPLLDVMSGFVRAMSAVFDPRLPVLGSANEAALTIVGDDQIASIYGVRFRSTPIFFITDDHDYFDNDDATKERVTFPPDAFHRALRNALQALYFPEFIVEREFGSGFPGLSNRDGVQLSSHFGEIQYGDLLSGLLYDCGGYLDLGAQAGLFPSQVETWLQKRTQIEDSQHLIHFPSHPLGWTAGKWREWYRDLLVSESSIVEAVLRDKDGKKYMWQEGWWNQHQRLVATLSAQTSRKPIMLTGDLHTLGATRIERSGDLDLSSNPVFSILSGPVGVGDAGWPSRARGVFARTPADLMTTELLALEERNGYALLEFDRDRIECQLFRCPQGYVSPSQLRVDLAARINIG
jgi:phosphodiesterase/alkaline phosphatase D-like protein